MLEVDGLSLRIGTLDGPLEVLQQVHLRVMPGQVVGLVGESGCGKSTLVRAILRILPDSARLTAGAIRFRGTDLATLDERRMSREIRARRIAFIPQDPYLALNPLFTVGQQLTEVLRWHGEGEGRRAWRARIASTFARVRLPEPEAMLDRYPHELSGGQRQRVLIAAALICNPEMIVADEPTTALDVTTQQQILVLLRELVEELGVAVLFVTHDFGVVAELCSAVTVMYAGQTVEAGPTAEILRAPQHPYTRRLVDCHPDRMRELRGIPGSVPSLIDPPGGCRFHPRCDRRVTGCETRPPRLIAVGPGHAVNCIHAEEAGQ
jgi:oligopeptide/dipeptide ABC transporter ATP-binding protein